jgi:hypothetical protein
VPYPLIYRLLEKCRDDFKLQEAVAKAQQELKTRQEQKTAAPPKDKSEAPTNGAAGRTEEVGK